MSKKYERYAKFNGIHLCHTFQEVTRYLHVGFLLVTMKVEHKKSKLIWMKIEIWDKEEIWNVKNCDLYIHNNEIFNNDKYK